MAKKSKKVVVSKGRYIFSNFLSKYFINISEIGHKYYLLMKNEYEVIQNFLKPGQNILSVGSGIGGLELLVSKKNLNTKVSFVEKNYISKKIIYGWDDSNLEAYNNLNLLEKFLLKNNMEKKSFQIFDFDKDKLPKEKFDLIISIYSLDFHYNFELYRKYFQEASNNEILKHTYFCSRPQKKSKYFFLKNKKNSKSSKK